MKILHACFAFMLTYGLTGGSGAAECQQIKFASGQSIIMPSALVKDINATTESGVIKVFSVSIIPPDGSEFAGVLSIIVEPPSDFSIR